jgi:hypothetical protein
VIESALFAPQTSFGGIEKYPELESKTAALLGIYTISCQVNDQHVGDRPFRVLMGY